MRITGTTIYSIFLLCVSVCAASFLSVANANVSQIQFENLSSKDGLSQVTINDIVEDQFGFIWIATQDGLNRYDGYDFKVYKSKRGDSSSIPNRAIRELFIDSKGRLWLATEGGIAIYNRESDNFTKYNTQNLGITDNSIWGFTETAENKLIVSAGRYLLEFNESDQQFAKFSRYQEQLPAAMEVMYSDNEFIWLGSKKNGLNAISTSNNRLFNLAYISPWNAYLNAASVFDIEKIDGNIWVATEQGIFVMDSKGEKVAHYSEESQPALSSNIVRSLVKTSEGKVWIGTEEGINILDLQSEQLFAIDASNEKSVNLLDRSGLKIFEDSNQTIWVGSHTKGIHKFNPNYTSIRHFSHNPLNENSLSNDMVWALDQDSNGMIWVGTQSGGINKFNPETVTFEHFLNGFNQLIYDLVVDKNDKIWIGTTNGLYAFSQNGSDLSQVAHLMQGEVVSYIKHFGDYVFADSGNGALIQVSISDFEISPLTTPNPNISSIVPLSKDSKNNLWVNTNNSGLGYFELESSQFNQLILDISNRQSFFVNVLEYEDSYWVIHSEEGIFELGADDLTVKRKLDTLPQLQDLTLLTAVMSGNSIWMASARVIHQLDLASGKIINTISSDLLGNNNLAEDSVLATNEGQLLFGGSEGIHLFWPEKLVQASERQLPPPTINGLGIHNKLVSISEQNSPLDKPIYLMDEVTLDNHDSPFSFHFAQINAPNSSLIEYRYKLQELSNNWLNADKRTREASFTNLSFGSYNFYVQNRFVNGQWSDSAHIVVNINPPIWLHRNAIVLYGFFLFLLFAYWFKQYKTKRANQLAIQESEERLKLTLWSSGDELWDWDVYRGQVFRANTWGTLDFPQDDIRANSSYQANIHQDDIPKVQQALKEHLEEETDHFQVAYRAKTFKGDWIWLLDRGKVVRRDNNNQPLRMTGTLKNITHLKSAEEQLKLYKRSIETISDGVFIADTSFKFISVNNSYCECTGETREQALASYLKFHQYPEAFTDEVKKSLQQKGNWFGEVESRRANGDKYEMELNIDAIHGEDGKISHYVGVFSDISSRKSTEKELLKLANTDPLTEMPNRSFFQASHNNLVRKNMHHALLCLDMDNFKKINDSLGHQAGDILIKQIGKRLQKISGTNSTCYRLGGDEFSILIDNTTDMHRITHFAQRILDDMARPFLINKQEFVLGASLGIAFYPEDGSSSQELLKNADTAMYFAKNAGGNKYQFFSGEMNQSAVRQLQIENLIRHGLKEDLFTVFYQPKVDIASGKLVSMEALVRFEHPDKGIVSPSQFIPLAEETGQIIDIGERVMQKACEDTKRWVQEGLFTGRVAVNISARQFELPDLDDRIDNILQKVGLSPLHLECEITEGTLMQNPDQALRMMERLREKGIHLALDDFGTGYSSLAYLKQFPLNTLKIDKAFIDDIATSSVDKHMTAAIINIAHNLGLKVVAEGVEQEQQLSILRRYDCEMLQGYLYSKPLSSARFERLLKENLQLTQLMSHSN